MKKFLVTSMLILFVSPALAVYKCESGGKVTYSDEACASGKELTISTGNDPVDIANTKRHLASEKTEANRLATVRQKKEAKDEKEARQVRRIAATKQKKCLLLAHRQRWAEEDAVKANRKSAEKGKRKAKRASEKYEIECGKSV